MVLDTHIFVRWVLGAPVSPERLEAIMRTPPEARLVSAVSLVEVAQLVWKGRLELELPVKHWLSRPFKEGILTLAPITHEIAGEAYDLPGEFHPDPADRIIVATARISDVPLMTDDGLIRKYPYVKLA